MPDDLLIEPAPTKDDIIRKVSQTLLNRRLLQNLTHEKVSQSTKIRVSFLKALEEGKWSDLPGEVYIRGFVTRYANFMGLKGTELIAPYFELSSAVPKKSVGIKPSSSNSPNISKLTFLWIGVGVFIVVGLIKVMRPSPPRTTSAIESTGLPVVKKDQVAVSTRAAEAPVSTVSHRMEIFSQVPLWLSVKAEGRNFEGYITQNSTWTLKASGPFSVHVGHTQISLYFDGKPVALNESQKKFTLPQ